MTVLEAFLQGLLQGLTEFLPVSSSGHLSLFQYFTNNSGTEAFAFSILLHAGTLVAVCIVFWKTIWALVLEAFALVRDLCTGKIRTAPMNEQRRMLLFLLLSLVPLVLMLFVKDWVEQFSTDRDITVEGFCFVLTGLLLLFASRRDNGTKTAATMTPRNALTIGVAQVLATMPGISRSGATITTGMLCGLSRSFAVTYSFILGIPAVLGAIVFEVPDALAQGLGMPISALLVGFASAVVFGVLSIKLVQWVVKGNQLHLFGWYTLALGLVCIGIGFYARIA